MVVWIKARALEDTTERANLREIFIIKLNMGHEEKEKI